MLPKRRCETVMVAHHVEALDERGAMVFRRQSAVEIVHHDHSDVLQRQVFALGLLHHADAPIDIGTEAIGTVVERVFGEIGTGVKRLMANQHSVAE